MVNVNGTLPVRHKTQWPYIFMTHPASPRAPSSNQETVGFPGSTHFGSAEDRVITNKAEGNPAESPAASWVFLVTGPEIKLSTDQQLERF